MGADRLISQSFYDAPVFRQRFDRHVKSWRRFVQRQVWVRYHTDPAFAAEYDDAVRAYRERISV